MGRRKAKQTSPQSEVQRGHPAPSLEEHTKGLQCLYDICRKLESSEVAFAQICREVINLLPGAWQYPDVACAELVFEGRSFRTDNYRDTEWQLASVIQMHGKKIGVVRVAYLEEKPSFDEGPFRTEERLLLDVVAERLGKVAERLAAQQALENSEHWYRLLADNVSDVIWTANLDMQFTYFSPSVTRMRGYTVDEAMAETLEEMLTPASYRVAMKVLKEELAIEARQHKDLDRTRVLEVEEYCKDGSTIWAEVKVSFLRDEAGKAVGVLGVARDITKRKRAEETIRQLAYYDVITGLPNRTLFSDRVNVAVAHARRNRQALAVMMLDLDRFKDINDRLGHETGDCFLRCVGERLVSVLRKSDTAARMGGDEFVILLPSMVRTEYAATVAQKIVAALRRPFVIDDQELSCTVSVGVATYPYGGDSARELIKNADVAMYQAKERGRDRYEVFTGGAMSAVAI